MTKEEKKKKRQSRNSRREKLLIILFIVIGAAAIGFSIFAVVRAAIENQSPDPTDAELLAGTWDEESGVYRWTFRNDLLMIETRKDGEFVDGPFREYRVDEEAKTLTLAADGDGGRVTASYSFEDGFLIVEIEGNRLQFKKK